MLDGEQLPRRASQRIIVRQINVFAVLVNQGLLAVKENLQLSFRLVVS